MNFSCNDTTFKSYQIDQIEGEKTLSQKALKTLPSISAPPLAPQPLLSPVVTTRSQGNQICQQSPKQIKFTTIGFASLVARIVDSSCEQSSFLQHSTACLPPSTKSHSSSLTFLSSICRCFSLHLPETIPFPKLN